MLCMVCELMGFPKERIKSRDWWQRFRRFIREIVRPTIGLYDDLAVLGISA
jgi:hypothetical protein